MRELKLFINNEWVDAENGATFTTVNPATGEPVSRLAKASEKDIRKAIVAAKAAAKGWEDTFPEERGKLMLRAAELIRDRAQELAEIESAETGKTLHECQVIDIPFAIRAFEYYGKVMTGFQGEYIELPQGGILDYVSYEPYGVVAVIAPWNFPIHLMTRDLCPALAAGNTIVAKGSSKTPTTTSLLGEIIKDAGFPAGVVNIISGPGGAFGNAVMSSPDVSVVAFTGSAEVGRELLRMNADAPVIKKLVLELGGKGAICIDKDAELNGAVNSALFGVCFNQGEVCCASSRVYVHEAVYDKFMDMLTRRFKQLKIGSPTDPETNIGTLIDQEGLEKVDGFVQRAVADGATIVTGGKRYTEGVCEKGFYYEPTILTNVREDMEIMKKEIFGPVLMVTKVKDLDEAIEKANDTDCGLGAAVWSENPRTLYRAGKLLKAGSVWQNYNVTSTPEAPYGGNKNSGFGREDGLHGLREFLCVKNNMQYVGPKYENFYGFPDEEY